MFSLNLLFCQPKAIQHDWGTVETYLKEILYNKFWINKKSCFRNGYRLIIQSSVLRNGILIRGRQIIIVDGKRFNVIFREEADKSLAIEVLFPNTRKSYEYMLYKSGGTMKEFSSILSNPLSEEMKNDILKRYQEYVLRDII